VALLVTVMLLRRTNTEMKVNSKIFFAFFLAKQISTAFTHVNVSGVTVLTAAVICYHTWHPANFTLT
jgi:hypothetical protein